MISKICIISALFIFSLAQGASAAASVKENLACIIGNGIIPASSAVAYGTGEKTLSVNSHDKKVLLFATVKENTLSLSLADQVNKANQIVSVSTQEYKAAGNSSVAYVSASILVGSTEYHAYCVDQK